MTSAVIKITNVPLGIDEMEFAHLLLDAMEAQQSSIKDTFLSCQILHKDAVAVLEFELPANSQLQWSNLENINIDGKNLQVMSVLSPMQPDGMIPNGLTTNGSMSHNTQEEEKMDVDEGVGSGSGESSPLVPEGNEEFLKMAVADTCNPSAENVAKLDEGKVESLMVNQPLSLSAQPISSPPPLIQTQPAPVTAIAQVANKPAGIIKLNMKPDVKPTVQASKQATQKTSRVVFFDLETTGLDKNTCEIVQIAAMSGPKYFNVYIKPMRGIPADASRINGLQVVGGQLLKNGQAVETVEPISAWKSFIEFLRGLENVILMGHYAHMFDFPLLVRDIQQHGLLPDLLLIVSGCVDTINVFRAKLPDRFRRRLSFKQVDLAKEYGLNTKSAHDALGDVRMLSQLCQKIGLTSQDIAKHRKQLKFYC